MGGAAASVVTAAAATTGAAVGVKVGDALLWVLIFSELALQSSSFYISQQRCSQVKQKQISTTKNNC